MFGGSRSVPLVSDATDLRCDPPATFVRPSLNR